MCLRSPEGISAGCDCRSSGKHAVPAFPNQDPGAKEGRTNEYDELHGSGIDIPGRLTLNLWRLLRGELKLVQHS